MKILNLYLIASFLWALIFGSLVGLAIVGISAGFTWLFIFGDSPWPTATEWILPLLGFGGALLTAITIISIGYLIGKQREARFQINPKLERRRAMAGLIAPIVLMLLAAAVLWINTRNYEHAINTVAKREALFANLVGSNQKIVAVAITSNSDGVIQTVVRISGKREGNYRLNWRVIPASTSHTIIAGDRHLNLRYGDEDITLSFPMVELQRQYQAVVLGGRGGVLVDERFQLKVFLDPILTQPEITALPQGEKRRLDTDDLPLRSRGTSSVPVRFTIAP